jgi:hypothetical protein
MGLLTGIPKAMLAAIEACHFRKDRAIALVVLKLCLSRPDGFPFAPLMIDIDCLQNTPSASSAGPLLFESRVL